MPANNNEFKSAVDEVKQTLASVGEIMKNTSDEVKTMKEASASEQESHAKALDDLSIKMKGIETFMARKPNVSDEKCLQGADNLKRFNASLKESTAGKQQYSLEEAAEIKAVYDQILTKGFNRCEFDARQKSIANSIRSTDGGYLTAPTYEQDLINRKFDVQGILGLVEMKNSSTGTLTKPVDDSDYSSWEYLNELANGDPEEHTPDYKDVSWNATEQLFKFVVSRTELEDAFLDVENDIIGKAAEGATRQSAAQIVLGDGVNRPKGFLSYEDGTGYNQIERVLSEDSGSIGWKDVITNLPKALIGGYHDNAKMAMNRQTFFDLLTDVDGAGQFNIMNQINFFSGSGAGMFVMGKEVVFDSTLQTSETGGNQAIIMGDFQEAYRFVQRVGFSLIVDDITSGRNVTYRLRRRNDGRLKQGRAVKILKIKA